MGKKKNKENILLNEILNVFKFSKKGAVLDLGCASGQYSIALDNLGFDVTATDVTSHFKHDKIKFVQFDSNKELPFPDASFDYVLLAEVIEHLKDPYKAIMQINRILKKGGKLILSTPNILNLKSRFRFLTEGTYEYYREPPLDHLEHNRAIGIDESQIHIVPYRYHELEFLMQYNGFKISNITTSTYEGKFLFFVIPLIYFQLKMKEKRSIKKGGVSFERINKIMLSKELLYGRHLIVSAEKI